MPSRVSDPPFTVLFVTPGRQFSLPAALFVESLRRNNDARHIRFRVRDYERVSREVDTSFLRDLLLLKPSAVAFSCFFWNLHDNLALARLAKWFDPSIVVILGGPQIGMVPDARQLAGAHPEIDVLLSGEADETLPQVLAELAEGHPPTVVPGATVRNNQGLASSTDACGTCDPLRIPVALHEGNEYVATFTDADTLTVQTVRGCRRRCSYCLYGVPRLRMLPLDHVEREIVFLCSRRIRRVRVADAHFGGTEDRALQLFEIIARYNQVTTFSIYPDPDHLSEPYVVAAARAQCEMISLGVLDSSENGHPTTARTGSVVRAIELMAQTGPVPQVDLVYGLPGQTPRQLLERAVHAARLGARKFLFSPLMLFPGTPLHQQAQKCGLAQTPTPQGFAFAGPPGTNTTYSEALVLAELFNVLGRLPRLSNAIWDEAPAEITESPALSAHTAERLVTISDALIGSGLALRRRARQLAEQLLELLASLLPFTVPSPPHLPELARLDFVAAAMRRRAEELQRRPEPSPRTTAIPDPGTSPAAHSLASSAWQLHHESWVDVFPGTGTEGGDVGYVFHCPTSSMWPASADEATRLQDFAHARPARPDDYQLVATWSQRGVLRTASES